MSGPPRIRSMNVAEDLEVRSVLAPAGNKGRTTIARKTFTAAKKPIREDEKLDDSPLSVDTSRVEVVPSSATSPFYKSPKASSPSPRASNVLRRHDFLLHSNLSLNASCSSDVSVDSVLSRASTGRISSRVGSVSVNSRRRPSTRLKPGKLVLESVEASVSSPPTSGPSTKRCAWVTGSTDPLYVTFHDEEWGMPVHDDKMLFEYLSLSGALAELTWPVILSKRHTFREVFADFDPSLVAKLQEKRVSIPGTAASSLLSESRLYSIIENARQILKVVGEFGSFSNYCWSFVNHKPIVNRFRYPRQVPVKTAKADVISKDMVKRGFRCVGPTVIYTFMQVAGITNDHLINCYRFADCLAVGGGAADSANTKVTTGDDRKPVFGDFDVSKGVEELGISPLSMKTDLPSDLVSVVLV